MCFEDLCRYFTDRPFSVRERASERRREITLRNRIGKARHFALQLLLASAHLLRFPAQEPGRLRFMRPNCGGQGS